MRRFSLVFIPILIFIMFYATASAEEKNRHLFLGIKSRHYFWDSLKEKQTTFEGTSLYDPDTIAEVRSDIGTSLGPEFEYYKEGFFLRGFYLFGKYNFDKGKADRNDMGVDVGYKFFFLGFRQMDASFKFMDADITDHSISDLVFGILLRSRPDKSGFIANFEMVGGVRGVFGSWSSKPLKEPLIVESEIGVGYKFKTIPLAFNIGYGAWIYEKPIREYETTFVISGRRVEGYGATEFWTDGSHGPTFKIAYDF